MKILQVHNQYQNLTGDDSVVEEEFKLLTSHGHEVLQYLKTNTDLKKSSFFKKVELGISLRGSKVVAREFDQVLSETEPDIIHCHNLFPIITPIVLRVAQTHGIPIVQTLHNYRLLCLNTLFYRDEGICEDCVTNGLKEGVKNKCYNGSLVQSRLMSDALEYHRKRDTWNKQVDTFICLSEFAKSKFKAGGIDESRLTVKANFVLEPKIKSLYKDFFLFAGKLEEQKGLHEFIELAKSCPHIKFKAAGYCIDPSIFEEYENVEYLGQLKRAELMKYMSLAKAILFLSKMYEGMPMTILEAWSLKKAVIARNHGAMKEMIVSEESGLLYDSFDKLVLATNRLNDQSLSRRIGAGGYDIYKEKYSDMVAYSNLINIYSEVIKRRND